MDRHIVRAVVLVAVGCGAAGIAPGGEAPGGFQPLFDGKTLAGWHALPGGSWKASDGLLVGTSVKTEKRHGLLVSDKAYGDFIVRLKFRVLSGNSGFYFRSEKVAGAVGVHGFQAEVDRTPLTGGLYETGGRTWVAQPDRKLTERIYKPGEWTEMSVTAIGRYVKVCVNGKTTAELKDDPGRLAGHFALQLHGNMDMEVQFKDIEIRKPTAKEAAAACDGFVPMFNGEDLTGWQTTGNWVVEPDGSIALKPRPGEKGWQRYDAYLTTKRKYKDFIIDLEFKFEPTGNSGVFLRVGDPKSQVNTGFEVQILDTHGKKNPGHHDCGGVIRTAGPSKNMVKPAGQWNRYVITCKGSDLKVVLNGEKIIDLDLSESPMKDRPLLGHIGFQDEAKHVWYRNVRIKELDASEPTEAPKGKQKESKQ